MGVTNTVVHPTERSNDLVIYIKFTTDKFLSASLLLEEGAPSVCLDYDNSSGRQTYQ